MVEKQPHGWAARAALIESLMYQRRYADAAAEAEHVPTDGEAAAVVVRSELFARLLIHDLTGADAALERAEQAGVPRAERDLFAAWLAQQRGALTPAPPAAGLPLLGTDARVTATRSGLRELRVAAAAPAPHAGG